MRRLGRRWEWGGNMSYLQGHEHAEYLSENLMHLNVAGPLSVKDWVTDSTVLLLVSVAVSLPSESHIPWRCWGAGSE